MHRINVYKINCIAKKRTSNKNPTRIDSEIKSMSENIEGKKGQVKMN